MWLAGPSPPVLRVCPSCIHKGKAGGACVRPAPRASPLRAVEICQPRTAGSGEGKQQRALAGRHSQVIWRNESLHELPARLHVPTSQSTPRNSQGTRSCTCLLQGMGLCSGDSPGHLWGAGQHGTAWDFSPLPGGQEIRHGPLCERSATWAPPPGPHCGPEGAVTFTLEKYRAHCPRRETGLS